jgi:hypothetical protein
MLPNYIALHACRRRRITDDRKQIGRTSSRQNKATTTRSKDFFMVEATSDRNEHMVLRHVSNQSGKKNDDRNKPLKIFHQTIRGLN